MGFKTPWFLILIPIVLTGLIMFTRKQKSATFLFPSKFLLDSTGFSWKTKFLFFPVILRYLVIGLFIIALAGPRFVSEETIRKIEGIDIVLTIDASGSMAAEDFVVDRKRVNRLEVVKNVVAEFIKQRSSDRIGLVAFAALAYTVTPLTTDYEWILKNLERIELGFMKDGTAIGSAIMTSISRLKTSKAKSKVVILLTDGVNNGTEISPVDAAKVAKSFGIKIYTICSGTDGYVPFPMQAFGQIIYQNVRIDIDEETMKQIATITGGRYFRATDSAQLKAIYAEIDALEKTSVEEAGYFEYTELYDLFLLAALGLLLLEVILSNGVLMRVP
ncbi:MAG: VWA domain-containing protein [Candidatus Omnitrophica bacterium]|nr:VWA domain-containing protein [Candidatus Omnitrophota bacterium]